LAALAALAAACALPTELPAGAWTFVGAFADTCTHSPGWPGSGFTFGEWLGSRAHRPYPPRATLAYTAGMLDTEKLTQPATTRPGAPDVHHLRMSLLWPLRLMAPDEPQRPQRDPRSVPLGLGSA